MGKDEKNRRNERMLLEQVVECEKCGRRYFGRDLAGGRCPKCMGRLIEVARARADVRPDEPIVEVHRMQDWMRAELVREHLEANGLLVALRTTAAMSVHPFTVDGLGEVAILALESDAARAKQLIAEYIGMMGRDLDSQEGQDHQDAEEDN